MQKQQAIQQLRNVLRRQHKALSTEDSYVFWLNRYMIAIKKMPPVLTSEQKLEQFLTDLARDGHVAASTQNQALNAVVFFYRNVLRKPINGIDSLRAKRPAQMRNAPSLKDTFALLQTVPNAGRYPTNLIARLLYGCGLRVAEPLNLRVKDVNLTSLTLCIRGAKGGKDRMVALPKCLAAEIKAQLRVSWTVWQRDLQNSVPLMLPDQLAKKYPPYQFAWSWAWVFPAHHPCRDPRSRMIVRYRMHEANVQRAIKLARIKLGIAVLPHELRHGYATHSLEQGMNPRAIQEAMGHKSLETTMGYLHAESLSVASPLENLAHLAAKQQTISNGHMVTLQ